ncbi:hypothetical protein [Amycolatopsis thailandensis]|uniref:hypothetical protein n=1 Tax=Amycolatopsis thailandensis TaxID=589330 RepID=UPI0036370FA4
MTTSPDPHFLPPHGTLPDQDAEATNPAITGVTRVLPGKAFEEHMETGIGLAGLDPVHTIGDDEPGYRSSGPAVVEDLVDHATVAVATCRLAKVTDGLLLDSEDTGTRVSSALGRRIVHRCSRSEHVFVDVDAGSAVRLVIDRSSIGEPVVYMAQSPSPGTGPGLYQQLVDATQSSTGHG